MSCCCYFYLTLGIIYIVTIVTVQVLITYVTSFTNKVSQGGIRRSSFTYEHKQRTDSGGSDGGRGVRGTHPFSSVQFFFHFQAVFGKNDQNDHSGGMYTVRCDERIGGGVCPGGILPPEDRQTAVKTLPFCNYCCGR